MEKILFKKANEFKERYANIKTPILQELIWFHRIKSDQDKELLTLEFLNVCASHSKEGKLFEEEDKINYKRDIELRNIIYNFPELEVIYKSQVDDNEKWKKIEDTLKSKFKNIIVDYSYLRSRFDTIKTFYTTVNLFKKASLGMNTNRRWTSKFLYPFAFETLFPDLDNRNDSFTIDRRFFSRGGEVLYLMISRGKNILELKKLMEKVYKENPQNKRWLDLYRILTNSLNNKDCYNGNIGFLRVKNHIIFDNLVKDLISLFKVNIPQKDYFYHLSNIVSFYFVHFILSISAEVSQESFLEGDNEYKIVYPIEILAPTSNHVRRASRIIYKINEELPLYALEKSLKQYLGNIDFSISESTLIDKLKELNLIDEDNYNLTYSKNDVYKKTIEAITKKFKRELKPIHRVLLKDAGLASVKKTNSYRYLMNDNFLKTLILINVENKKNFDDFINLLYLKYGFIISKKHSVLLKEKYAENDFEKNKKRFFEKLKSIGYLENKSDGYTYVINRFGKR